MQENSELREYIKVVGESSQRSRMVIFIIITACILSFAGFLNSRSDSWTNERVRVSKIAEAWLRLTPEERDSLTRCPEEWFTSYRSDSGTYTYTFSKQNIVLAENFIAAGEITTRQQISQIVADFMKMKIDNVILVRIPFFGIQFDVNDLGLISGITFITLLLMLRFCLKREVRNLRFTFEQSKTLEERRYCYEYLSMMQVLTVPPVLDGRPRERFWMRLPKKLVILPLIMHSMVFANDLMTLKFGFALSFSNTLSLVIFSSLALGIIGMLSYRCHVFMGDIDAEWAKQAVILTKKPID